MCIRKTDASSAITNSFGGPVLIAADRRQVVQRMVAGGEIGRVFDRVRQLFDAVLNNLALTRSI